jgi:hypothetical protein
MQEGKKEKPNASNDWPRMPPKLPKQRTDLHRVNRLVHPMSNPKVASGEFAGEQRTNIRMSKLARIMQTSSAKSNWGEMAKMLFRSDPNSGRKQENQKLLPLQSATAEAAASSSYGIDQMQYLLFLMLVISVAEKRTQEVYGQDFAQRCDAISKRYNLNDDEYWKDGMTPAEWNDLNREFEERSLEILLQTLREYHQEEIAHLVETDGAEDFFQIIKNIRAQFLHVLTNSDSGSTNPLSTQSGSLPETLQSAEKDQDY